MNTTIGQPYALSTNFKRKKYLKYDWGGDLDPNTAQALSGNNGRMQWDTKPQVKSTDTQVNTQAKGTGAMNGGVAALNTTASIVDAVDTGEGRFGGRKSVGSSVVKGAASGASMGAVAGPWGALIGGVVGATAGWIGGAAKKKKYDRMEGEYKQGQQVVEQNRMGAKLMANPELYQGNYDAQYMETGGKLSNNYLNKQYAVGGNLIPQSSDGIEANGNTHAQGGIKLPEMGAEIEDGETVKDDYVFSKKLGFADLHKPIMKAKGKIEAKPFTPERANSIKLLNAKEDRLKTLQERYKQSMGIQ